MISDLRGFKLSLHSLSTSTLEKVDVTMRLNDTDLDIRTQKIPVLTYNDSLANSIEDLTIESPTTSKTSRSTRKRYRNKTFIDWIYEYELAKHVKETVTNNGSPLLQMYIPKSKWVVLSISSITMGVLVVLIDFLSLWLHDKNTDIAADMLSVLEVIVKRVNGRLGLKQF